MVGVQVRADHGVDRFGRRRRRKAVEPVRVETAPAAAERLAVADAGVDEDAPPVGKEQKALHRSKHMPVAVGAGRKARRIGADRRRRHGGDETLNDASGVPGLDDPENLCAAEVEMIGHFILPVQKLPKKFYGKKLIFIEYHIISHSEQPVKGAPPEIQKGSAGALPFCMENTGKRRIPHRKAFGTRIAERFIPFRDMISIPNWYTNVKSYF